MNSIPFHIIHPGGSGSIARHARPLACLIIILSGAAAACSRSSANEARAIYARGIAHYEKKELDAAARCFEESRSRDGNFPNAALMLAKARYFTGKRAEAREILGDLLAHDPSHVGALYWKARSLVADIPREEGGSAESEAMELLGKALEIDGHNIQARTLLALLYEKKKMYREALREYRAALQEEESLISARANAGILYQRLGLRDRAVSEIDDAITIARAAGVPADSLAAIKKEMEAR